MEFRLKYKGFYIGKKTNGIVSETTLIKDNLSRTAIFFSEEEADGFRKIMPLELLDDNGNKHLVVKSEVKVDEYDAFANPI